MLVNIIVGLLTIILFLNSIVLILLVLMQLPKKEAGLGTAFGGGATDALFGANTGNVLTVATKYSAIIFLSVSLILSVINSHRSKSLGSTIDEALNTPDPTPVPSAVVPAPVTPEMDEELVATNSSASLETVVSNAVKEAEAAVVTETKVVGDATKSLLDQAIEVATNEVEKATGIKVEIPKPGDN